MVVQTIIEIILAALVICGFIFETKIAEWEEKVFSSIKKKFKDYRAELKRKKFVVIESE